MPLEPGQAIPSLTNRLKAASLIFFPSALILGLLLSLFSFLKLQSEQTILKAHEWSHVETGEEAIAHEFEGAATDLACLANSTVLRNFLNTNEMTYLADLNQEYLTLVANSQMYDQVRFLAANGREKVRVNFQAGQPSIVPRKDLQSKGERYYFKDIFSLQQDEVFVSPLDLNIEHGKIELPRKPMIRFGTPVFDGQGQKRGIVLLNYFGQILLDHLKMAMQDSAIEHTRSSDTKSTLEPHISLTGKAMLINQEGFWLLGLKPEEEWGFMYHNDQTMAHKYPTAWQTISRQKSGQFLSPSGMFTFITIHPLQIGHISSTGSPHPFQKSAHRLETAEYHWKLVSFVSAEDFRAFNFHFLRASFILYGAILLFLLPASFYFGRQRLLTLQTEETLRRYEFIVNKSQDLMTLIDHEYRYLAVSDSFCSMHKKTRPEILGSTVAEVWGTAVFKEDIKPYLDQCLAGELISYSAWFAMPATDTCFYDVTLAPFQDLAKDTYYGVVISRDITARKKAEEKLIESHDRMQTILDNVDAMIYIIDAATHEIVMINQYGRDLFGAVEGKKCWQALQKDQDGPCPFCKPVSAPESADKDFQSKSWATQNSRNGRWYEIHDNQITWIDDRLVRLLVATDISERQESEAKLHEYASVQKILLSEVNHRVKNNLAAIISMLHMEEARVANKDATIYSETIHDLVARIHGLALVHSLLSASEWLPLKISYLCEEVAKAALHGLHNTKEIALTVADSPALIGSSQAHHLAMVINELTTNTLKYSIDNRETAHIDITIDQQEDDQVTIVFHDDGPGYPPAICTGDMSQASTGLEIVQGIITSSLQGTVHFNNDNGAVSHFTFKTELDNDI